MKTIICFLIGHEEHVHLDYIYGSLPREHRLCERCTKNLMFDRPTMEREKVLIDAGDIRDGDVRGCNPIN